MIKNKRFIILFIAIISSLLLITNNKISANMNKNEILHSKIAKNRLNKAGYVFRIPKNQVQYYDSVNFTKTNIGNNTNKLSKKEYVKQLSKNITDFKVINAKQHGPEFMYKLSNKNNTINCWVDWSHTFIINI